MGLPLPCCLAMRCDAGNAISAAAPIRVRTRAAPLWSWSVRYGPPLSLFTPHAPSRLPCRLPRADSVHQVPGLNPRSALVTSSGSPPFQWSDVCSDRPLCIYHLWSLSSAPVMCRGVCVRCLRAKYVAPCDGVSASFSLLFPRNHLTVHTPRARACVFAFAYSHSLAPIPGPSEPIPAIQVHRSQPNGHHSAVLHAPFSRSPLLCDRLSGVGVWSRRRFTRPMQRRVAVACASASVDPMR
jgi:hypothetical protein